MSARATAGKVLMGAAVLVPAMVIAYLIMQSRMFLIKTNRGALTKAIAVDAAVLLLGWMLNRGEDL